LENGIGEVKEVGMEDELAENANVEVNKVGEEERSEDEGGGDEGWRRRVSWRVIYEL
jgi:hypothetical protein